MNEIAPINSGALMSFIERASRDASFDVAKFGELLKLQREVMNDSREEAFNFSMSAAQAEMVSVVRNAKNTHLGSTYATLDAIDAGVRPIYTKHGFSIRFGTAESPLEGHMRVTCKVAHANGHSEVSWLDAPMTAAGAFGGRTQTTPIQAVGSVTTYLRRYLLLLVFNISVTDADDDGESQRDQPRAQGRPQAQAQAQPQQQQRTAASQGQRVNEKPMTQGEFMDSLEAALGGASTRAEVDHIIASPVVQSSLKKFTNSNLERLTRIISAATVKVFKDTQADEQMPMEDAKADAPAESGDGGWPEADTGGVA